MIRIKLLQDTRKLSAIRLRMVRYTWHGRLQRSRDSNDASFSATRTPSVVEATKETYIVNGIGRVLGIKVDGRVPSVLTEEIPCKKLFGRRKVHDAKPYHAAKMRVAMFCF